VNDTVYVGAGCKNPVEGGFVGDIQLVEVGLLAADQLYAVENFLRRIVEVVHDDDLVAGLEESEGGERADVASATAKISRRPLEQEGFDAPGGACLPGDENSASGHCGLQAKGESGAGSGWWVWGGAGYRWLCDAAAV
jgi:hypothetical protein